MTRSDTAPVTTGGYDTILFDLDGTVIDSEPGIETAMRYALTTGFNIDATPEQLREFMGPPLAEIFPRVFGITDPADHARFFALYCEKYFHDTERDFEIYPGMRELIDDLRAAGIDLVLATAKPQESAERILAHAGLLDPFTFVAGSASDGTRQDKAEVIEHAFANVEPAAPTDHTAGGRARRMVMVGDRELDAVAARAHGIDCILVTWGYAPEGELDAVFARDAWVAPAHSVAELRHLLLT